MNHKFKRQLIIISVSKFKTQNLNQELKKSNPAVYELREQNMTTHKLKIQWELFPEIGHTLALQNLVKKYVVGDSHIRRIKRNVFNNSLYEGEAYLNGFSAGNIKHLDHFTTPTLVEDQPDIVIIHIGSNDITHNTVNQTDVKDIVNRIINIGKKCLSYGVKELIISSIFMKKPFKLTRIINRLMTYYA